MNQSDYSSQAEVFNTTTLTSNNANLFTTELSILHKILIDLCCYQKLNEPSDTTLSCGLTDLKHYASEECSEQAMSIMNCQREFCKTVYADYATQRNFSIKNSNFRNAVSKPFIKDKDTPQSDHIDHILR